MKKKDIMLFSGEVVDENQLISLAELLELCQIEANLLQELVDYGLLTPQGETPEVWQFTMISVPRTKKAIRLYRDLGINWQGVAVALDLLDEVEQLRHRVELLEKLRG